MGRKSSYIRLATYPVDEVLPYIFTKEVRRALREAGYGYNSREWKRAASHRFWYAPGKSILIPMGSHRYQLYAEKGTVCVSCGFVGTFFCLEKAAGGGDTRYGNYHLNLYGLLPGGGWRMMTKDHIVPRSKGGKNRLENYQPMCERCNHKKGNKVITTCSK